MCETLKELLRESHGMSLYAAHRIETLISNIRTSNDEVLFLVNELNKLTSKIGVLTTDIEKEVLKANTDPAVYRFKGREKDA